MQIKRLGQKFKLLEDNKQLAKKQTFVIRLDGKAFHSMTRTLQPFSQELHIALVDTAKQCCKEIQGAILGYIQSDEVSIICSNKQAPETEHWFGGKIQKIVSVSASMFTGYFNRHYVHDGVLLFDSRVHPLPEHDVYLYLMWRYLDCVRNSINKLGMCYIPKKELKFKSQQDVVQTLQKLGVDWKTTPSWFKYGTLLTKTEQAKLQEVDTYTLLKDATFITDYLDNQLNLLFYESPSR